MNWHSSGKKALKIIISIILVLFVLALITITTVDRSQIHNQDFYKTTLNQLEESTFQTSLGETWLAGWASSNMTPERAVDLVGYAPRGTYEFVQDSSFVRALTLSNGKTQIAWLNYELLIVHPSLAEAVEAAMKRSKLPIDQLVFTATHTHSGMGGYMPGPLGELAFGGFDQTTVDLIVANSISALKKALSNKDTVSISFRKVEAAYLVANRFIKDDPIDPFVRQLIFKRNDGKKATFLTYSAHATTLSSKFMGLSGDYPHYLIQALESVEYDFALFAAGTVGSHRPVSFGNTPELVSKYALALDSTIRVRMTQYATINRPEIGIGRLDIQLREPHLRVSDELRIRPWLFDYLLGDTNPHLDYTLIGNTLMIGSSGELSGVFYEKWEKSARSKGLNLIITTFNGGYIGYVTPDSLYDRHFHEVREMNWYGPGNGAYFDALIEGVIEKVR